MPRRPQDNRTARAALSPWVSHLASLAHALDRITLLRIILRPLHRLCISPRLAVARAVHPGLLRPSQGCLTGLRRTASRSSLWVVGLWVGLAAGPVADAARPAPVLQLTVTRRQADEPPKPPQPRPRKTRFVDARIDRHSRAVR